jgi:transcriptional regulator with XRE-family HTH domain
MVVQGMHLISYAPRTKLNTFYQKRPSLSRPDSLAHIFLKLRQNRNLTKRSLGDKFSLSEEYVSSVESGSKFPSLSFSLKCAREFGINPNYVKSKWAREVIERFSDRLSRRLGLED